MASITMNANCVCGNHINMKMRKPTRMTQTIAKVVCDGCLSKYLVYCSVDTTKKGRMFKAETDALEISDLAKEILKLKLQNDEISA